MGPPLAQARSFLRGPLPRAAASSWSWFLLALAVETAYFFASGRNPFFLYYIPPDQHNYLNAANAILRVNPLGPNPFRVPLYPYIVAFFQAWGVETGFSLLRAAQAVAAAASVAILFGIGRSLGGVAAGGVSALLLLLYWPFTLHAGEVLGETFFILLALSAFALVLRAGDGGRWGGMAAASGLLLGAGSLIRPNALFVVPAWLLFLAAVRREPLSWRALRAPAWFLAGFCSLLLLNGVRNQVNFGSFTLLTHQGPVNFYIGNRPGADGITAFLPGLEPDWEYDQLVAFTRRTTGVEMGFSEVMAFWEEQAGSLLVQAPGSVVANMGKKALLFLNDYEIPNTRALSLLRRTTPLLQALFVDFALILALAGVGLAAGPWRDLRFRVLAGTAALYSLGVVAIFVCSRYRLPAVPFLALLGGMGAAALVRALSERRFRAAAAWILLALALFAASRVELFGVRDEMFRGSERKEAQEVQRIMRLSPR